MIPVLEAPSNGSSSRADPRACEGCNNGERLGFEFSYAYQPIVDVTTRTIFAHEALIRGVNGESAGSVLSQVTDNNRYKFDQACRVKAIRTAASIQLQTRLSINFLPNAIYRPEVCIRTTLEAARAHNFPIDRIMFETIEGERVADVKWFAEVLREYQNIGFLSAIDDFGAGYAGLNLLADFQPDVVKLDMDLIRNIDTRRSAQVIVRGITGICEQLDIQVIAEGVETTDEYLCLEQMGLHLMQGYLFAKPLFQGCADETSINWPVSAQQGTSEQANLMLKDDVLAGVDARSPLA
ncbi:MAG: EAL domain-containing protein [Phycisphaerae bacterium]|nr:EAL domain-containing protein [Gemmatimonadaceae bacterium]